MTGKKILAALKSGGFVVVSVEGSHYQLRRIQNGERVGGIVTVPVHGSAIVPQGTFRAILKQAGLSIDEFRKHAG